MVSNRFTSEKRVRQSQIFLQAIKSKGLINNWFIINTVDSKTGFPRLGMIISKRTIAKSVYRNLAKRIIRDLFRHYASELPPLDYIIRIRRNINNESRIEIREALMQLLLRAKAL